MKFKKNNVVFETSSAIQADAFIAEGFVRVDESIKEENIAKPEVEIHRKPGRPPKK